MNKVDTKQEQNKNKTIIMQSKLVYTPIAKNYKKKGKPDSRKDFEEQQILTSDGKTWMWDADPKNTAKKGDIFAFVKNKKDIQFHRITDVRNPTERLDSWRDNVGQGKRNVLFLSDPIYIMEWDMWIDLNGAKRVMGTAVASVTKSDNILEFISKKC